MATGQFKINFWTNLVDLESRMIYTKIHLQKLFGPTEEAFKCFSMYGHDGHLV